MQQATPEEDEEEATVEGEVLIMVEGKDEALAAGFVEKMGIVAPLVLKEKRQ